MIAATTWLTFTGLTGASHCSRFATRRGLLWATTLLVSIFAGPTQAQLDRIVAVVNTDVIVQSELDSRINRVRAQMRASETPAPSITRLEQQVLERLVLERLQLQLATRLGVRVDDQALNQAIAGIARKNNLSLQQFRNVLERDGIDYGDFRENIRDEMRISRVRQREVNNRIQVTDRDIDNFLANEASQGSGQDRYLLKHILVALPEPASPEDISEARAKVESILSELAAGTDFGQVAAARSDGQRALQGGELGWRTRAELPTIFADVVPRMSAGQIAQPIRSPSGIHIIKLAQTDGAGGTHMVRQSNARHILLRTNELVSPADARLRLEQLRERAINGDDFSTLARSHSEDTSSAVRGGEIGWVTNGDVVPRFQQAMDALEPMQISAPFQTQFGWHIVQVMERRDHDGTTDVERARASEAVRKRKTEAELESWLRQMRDEAYVELRLDR